MKLLFLLLIVLSSHAFAETRVLICEDRVNVPFAYLGLHLDNSMVLPNSGYFDVVRASFSYQYSSASLICSKTIFSPAEAINFSCIGYNSIGGLTELSVAMKDGKGSAKIHNFGDGVERNVYAPETEGKTLLCRI